ncbi:MAG: hypothetical protein Q8914_07615 [Bacteroidota bacterium]|nr:hypothetical protein [Bacteroidota bacterium]
MPSIQSTAQLKEAIRQLESERIVQKQQLEQSIRQTVDKLNPINLLGDILQEATSVVLQGDRLLGSTISLATSFLLKRIITGKSGNKIRTLLGLVAEFGIKNLMRKHRAAIGHISQRLLLSLFHKK